MEHDLFFSGTIECGTLQDPWNVHRVEVEGGGWENGVVTYRCNSGYVLHTGEETYSRTCTASGWTESTPICNSRY